jgi:hypothetical protein
VRERVLNHVRRTPVAGRDHACLGAVRSLGSDRPGSVTRSFEGRSSLGDGPRVSPGCAPGGCFAFRAPAVKHHARPDRSAQGDSGSAAVLGDAIGRHLVREGMPIPIGIEEVRSSPHW